MDTPHRSEAPGNERQGPPFDPPGPPPHRPPVEPAPRPVRPERPHGGRV